MYNQALEQFRILSLSIFGSTYPSYFLGVLIICIFTFSLNIISKSDNYLFISKSFFQMILENLYLFVLDVVKQNIGVKGLLFFPIIFNIFYFVYFVNIGGLVGYNIQLTSHIIVTFTLSITLFLGLVVIGLHYLKKSFINQFIPKDAPKPLFPLLVVIEVISYSIRPFTLGIRLFANMFSGHVLLFVISSFVVVIVEKKIFIIKLILMILPTLLFFFIMSLELLIAFLQAYVFIILCCVYLHDALISH